MSDDELREEITKTRALREMDTNSTVEKFICHTDFVFDFTAEWNDGAATMGGSKYRKVSRSWDLTREEAEEIKTTDDIDDWVNENKEKVADEMLFSTYKNVNGKIHPVANLYYLIEFMDGDTTWLKQSKKIKSTDYFSLLAPFKFSEQEIFVEPSSEESVVRIGKEELELEVSQPKSEEQTQIDQIIKDYLSRDSVSVNCMVKSVEEVEEELRVSFETSRGYEYDLRFPNPTDNRSDVWNLLNEFSYKDPWNLENEEAYYSIVPVGDGDMYNADYINISSDEVDYGRIKRTKIGFIERIRRVLP